MKNKITRILLSIIETLVRNISGGLGQKIRYFYYKNRFKSCGSNVKIGIGVVLQGCEFIEVSNNVWIDDYCTLIAGKTGDMKDREVKIIRNKNFTKNEGLISIGNYVHIAPYCIIHGYGGVEIRDFVGFSSGVKLYSMSNHYQSFSDKSLITYNNPMVKNKPVVFIKSPIVIEENVFVSLNSIILFGTIGKDSFVSPMTVVTRNIPPNSIITGSPAKRIKERFKDYNVEEN